MRRINEDEEAQEDEDDEEEDDEDEPRLKYSTLPPMLFPYWLQSIGPMDGAALARTVSAGLDFFNSMAVQGVRHSSGSINLFLQLGTNISGNDELIGRCTGCLGNIYRN